MIPTDVLIHCAARLSVGEAERTSVTMADIAPNTDMTFVVSTMPTRTAAVK